MACVCVNDEVIHGIPGKRKINPDDLVGIDVGLQLDGWCGDVATSLVVSDSNEKLRRDPVGLNRAKEAHALIADTRRVLQTALNMARPGVMWSSIGLEMERLTHQLGRGIITQYVGHGIGRQLHEPPKVPAYWSGFEGPDFCLQQGMVLAVEPILTVVPPRNQHSDPQKRPYKAQIKLNADGWTIQTADGQLACHEERVIVIHKTGARLLSGSLPGSSS